MFDTSSALCRQYDPAMWDPENGPVHTTVVRICAACPLNEACLKWALTHDEYGIWAGLSRAQRRQLRSGKHRARCPDCGTNQLWGGETDQTCAFCGLSWNVRRKIAEPAR